MTMSVETGNRRLAGLTKQYLDDLLTLNTKTTEEMVRGVQDNYLDVEGAIELAGKLNVEPPRVKRTFTFYFTKTEVFSIQVRAYDEDQGEREAERLHRSNAAAGELYHGSRSRFTSTHGRIRRFFSPLMRQRPQPAGTFPLHPFSAQLADAEARGDDAYTSTAARLRMEADAVRSELDGNRF